MTEGDELHDVVVVGAGFAGIAMGVALKASGRDFLILEKADEIGGTWRENRYPGCACDVPAHLYSFSFEPNPYWSKTFADADEIQDYLLYCVEKYALRPHVRTDATVQHARYDAATGVWTVTVASAWGELRQLRARALVLGVGALHEPVVPDLPGLETFEGELRHTATWDRGLSVQGRRVGVIGTGSSGVQIIPPLAEDAAHLTVFQRTPAWVLPRDNTDYSEATIDRFERHPMVMRAHRTQLRATHDARGRAFTDHPGLLRAMQLRARRHLAAAVSDPTLRERLTPGYTMGCKRILLSDAYYPAMARPDVTLATDAIERVEPRAVVTADGTRHEVDFLVLATGFDPIGSYRYLGVAGLDGRVLGQEFAHDAQTYLGVTVPAFPNLFVLLGPNTLLGHTSVLLMLEAQVALTMRLLDERDRRGARAVQVRPEVVPGFMAEIDRRSEGSVWESGCHSWYLDDAGRNRTLWPGSVREYERRLTRPELVDYTFG